MEQSKIIDTLETYQFSPSPMSTASTQNIVPFPQLRDQAGYVTSGVATVVLSLLGKSLAAARVLGISVARGLALLIRRYS